MRALLYKGVLYRKVKSKSALTVLVEKPLDFGELQRVERIVKDHGGDPHGRRKGTETEFYFKGDDSSVDVHIEQVMEELESQGFQCDTDIERGDGDERVWSLYVWVAKPREDN